MEKTGKEKARETADKIKADNAAKEEVAGKNVAQAKEQLNQLATIQQDSELAQMYNDNAKVGAENLGGEVPLLKVHATGRSNSELADGTEPPDGSFFYKPTQEAFEEVTCHILTISKGFRAKGLEDDGEEKFNQLLGGMLVADGNYQPFVMYFTGLKLSYLWDFGKSAGKYTRRKPLSIPMFALTVKLTTEKIPTSSYGKVWIVNFEIEKQEDTNPSLVADAGEFQFLKDSAVEMQDMIESIIAAKSKVKVEEPVTPLKTEEPPDYTTAPAPESEQ